MCAKMFEATRRTTNELFSKDPAAFVIPPHQREYKWTADEVQQLLADLFEDSIQTRPYFLGPLLFAKSDEGEGFQVLDGQQRLVTVSLLVTALKFRLEALGDGKTAGKLENVIKAGKITEETYPKLTLQPDDEPVYREILELGTAAPAITSKSTRKRPIVRAWLKIWDYVNDDQKDLTLIKAMVDRVLYNTDFVQIEATNESEAFTLFETLNNRGLDLNASDLVKNRVLSMVSKERLVPTRDEWVQALKLVKEDDTIQFLRHYHLAHHGFVRKDELYDAIKDALKVPAKEAEKRALAFVKHLRLNAETYKHILNPKGADTPWADPAKESLERLRMMNARGFRPVVLLLQEKGPAKVAPVLQMLEGITVRYSVVGGKNPNKLEVMYSNIAEDIRRHGIGRAEEIVAHHVSSLMPSDDDFRADFASYEVENITAGFRGLLAGLHAGLTGGATTPASPSELHVDHVLARSLPREALEHGGFTAEEAGDLVTKIGNYTFLLAKPNIQVGNSSFPQKKSVYKAAEGLPMTQQLAEYGRWDKVAIQKRTADLANLAVKTWPIPKAKWTPPIVVV